MRPLIPIVLRVNPWYPVATTQVYQMKNTRVNREEDHNEIATVQKVMMSYRCFSTQIAQVLGVSQSSGYELMY